MDRETQLMARRGSDSRYTRRKLEMREKSPTLCFVRLFVHPFH